MTVAELKRMLEILPQDADVIVVLGDNYRFKPIKVEAEEREEVKIIVHD